MTFGRAKGGLFTACLSAVLWGAVSASAWAQVPDIEPPPAGTLPEPAAVNPAPAPASPEPTAAPAGTLPEPVTESPAPAPAPASPAPTSAPPPPPLPAPASEKTPPLPAVSELDLFNLETGFKTQVVTASGGVEEERAIASANVFVVQRQTIASHGWRSLAEVLANVPGLYIIDDQVLPTLGVRGVTGGLRAGTRVVKVMIDGQQVHFRPMLSAFLGPEYIPMEAVERIEVAKGPLSALYGANAFIATVNVITRKGAPSLTAELGARLTVFKSPGPGGSALISYEGKNRGVLFAFSIDELQRNGLALQTTFPGQDPLSGLFDRPSADDVALPISALARFHVGSERLGTFTLQGGVQRLDSAGQFQLNSVLTDRTRITILNVWSNARYEKNWKKGALTASLGYSNGAPAREYELILTGSRVYTYRPNFAYNSIDAVVRGTYTPLEERLSLSAGLDFEYSFQDIPFYTQIYNQPVGVYQAGDRVDLIGAKEPRSQSYYDVGLFLQATSVPFSRLPGLHLTGNFRIDKIAFGPVDFPVQYSFRAAVAYRWNANWVTKLIGGRAFQTPSGEILFGHSGFGNANNIIGNVAVPGLAPLRPQSVNNIELIATGQFLQRFTLDIAFYIQDLLDRIEFIQNGLHFTAVNQGQRVSLGVESTLRFQYRWLSIYGSGSIDAQLLNGRLVAQPTPLYPRGLGVIGLDVDIRRIYLHANTQVRIVGPRGASQSNVYLNNSQFYELPTYAIFDITLSTAGFHLFGADAETKILVSGRNLADQSTPDPGFAGIDLPRIGRNFFFEIRQTF